MSLGPTIKDWVKQWTARLVRYGILAHTESTGFDQLEGAQGDGVNPSYQQPARRFQHYGFRSRPRVGAEIICVAPRGGTSNRVSIASEVSGQGPQDQEEGEVEVYSQFGQRLRLISDGSFILKESSGGQIVFAQKVWSVDSTVESRHFQGKGAAPTAIPGPGLGGGAAIVSGTDAGFTLNLVVMKPGPGPLATVLFANAYPVPPRGIGLCALDSATAKAMTLTHFYLAPMAASLQIFADGLLPGVYNVSLLITG